MKFGGHETFHLRDNWIFKGLRMLNKHGDMFSNSEKSIELLGVGTNMVKSIKHWLIATGLAETKKGKLHTSSIGDLIMGYDQYFDRLGSSWVLHYLLSTNEENATTWYWFFNKFGVSEFTSESASHYLENYCSSLKKKVNSNTLGKDINTLLRMYIEPEFTGNKSPEDNNICPLSRLALIKKQTNGAYRVCSPETDEIPIEIFGFCLINFWINQLDKISEFSFDELVNKDCSPSKVFCLNSDKTIDLLGKLVENYPNQFSYRRAGGFFTISIHSTATKRLLNAYYGE